MKLIKNPSQGLPAARNAGVEASKGNILVFLDSDCVVGRDLVAKLIGPLQNPEVGVAQPWWDNVTKDRLVPLSDILFICKK